MEKCEYTGGQCLIEQAEMAALMLGVSAEVKFKDAYESNALRNRG
jgi:hypothetical protein